MIVASSDVNTEEACRRIVRNLERRGATSIKARGRSVHFRAQRAWSNWNSLTFCRSGMFHIEKVPGGFRIEYELDLLYLLLWTSVPAVFLCVFLCVFCFVALLNGNVGPLVPLGAFSVAAIPLNYAFYFWRAKSLFATAARSDSNP